MPIANVSQTSASLSDVFSAGALQSTSSIHLQSPNLSWIDSLPHGLCCFDATDRLVIANRQFRQWCGLKDVDVNSGTSMGTLVSIIEPPAVRNLLTDVIATRGSDSVRRSFWKTKDGRSIQVCCQIEDSGSYIVLLEDISRLLDETSAMAKLANVDALTGLQNRHAFSTLISQYCDQLRESEELAVLYIDLDHFKPINDMYGHPMGDQVLTQVAKRLVDLAGKNDAIARIGGDEFVILQRDQPQPVSSRNLAAQVIQRLSNPFHIDGQILHIGSSVGVAIAPYDAENADDLIKNADLALYGAKNSGRGVLRFFEPSMDSKMKIRRSLERELRDAIDAGQFELHYQPLMDLEANRIVCFEALLRWHHPTMGSIGPDQFIPLAEETGLILPLGDWVIRTACLEATSWRSEIGLAVNLSAIQLHDRGLYAKIRNVLHETGLDAQRLELEITETALLSNSDFTIGLLHQLRGLGVRIALDDFGTGYSSINYLRRFPFDKIKIDRSFVSGSNLNSESTALVKMIAALGISLGIKTTAEGVETLDEMSSVRAAGCSEIQGYLLSRPVTAAKVRELLEETSINHLSSNYGSEL